MASMLANGAMHSGSGACPASSTTTMVNLLGESNTMLAERAYLAAVIKGWTIHAYHVILHSVCPRLLSQMG
jgi:hypothetical protein